MSNTPERSSEQQPDPRAEALNRSVANILGLLVQNNEKALDAIAVLLREVHNNKTSSETPVENTAGNDQIALIPEDEIKAWEEVDLSSF